MIELLKIYEATNQGLDIILDLVPQAKGAECDSKHIAFKYRTEERTASAYLVEPNENYPHWSLVDYGISDKPMSPIKLYMRECGMDGTYDYGVAIRELAAKYGVTDEINKSVNIPRKEVRDARDGEVDGQRVYQLRDGYTETEIRVWGPCVTANILKELGWQAVEYIGNVRDGKVAERHCTEYYPIFAQHCPYINKEGNQSEFLKFYEPLNPDKRFRFSTIGTVPKDYIYGLENLKRRFHLNDDKKLFAAVIVSGGSDAANCLSMGYVPVWFNSETSDVTKEQISKLYEFASNIYHVPDMDSTGRIMGNRFALNHLTIKSVYLPEELGRFKDRRGRNCKDLSDYVKLHPQKDKFDKLIKQAVSGKFFMEVKNKDGKVVDYNISISKLNHFLELNGYYTLRCDRKDKPVFIHVDGVKVKMVKASDILQFLKWWMESEGLPVGLRDKVLRSKDLPTPNSSTLKEVDLDFTSFTPSSQRMYFKNCWIEITANGITKHRYNDMGGNERMYVWEDKIIQHDYKDFPSMFNITTNEDGSYDFELTEAGKQSELLIFLIHSSYLYWRKEMEQGLELTDEEYRQQVQCLMNKIFVLGYYLHLYKSDSRTWAAFLYDNYIGEVDECNGRSGKSFFAKILKHFISVFFIDAKNPDIINRQFLFDGVTEKTDVVFLDECHRKLYIDFFYGLITDEMRVEEKGCKPFTLTYSVSPKFLFAANHVLSSNDPSLVGRIIPTPFSDYYHVKTKDNDYSESRSIRDDFGHNLFDSQYKGWEADIAVITQCIQFYLSICDKNEKILPPMNNYEKRQLREQIGKTFEEWASDYFSEGYGHLNVMLKYDDVFNAFVLETNNKNYQKKTFTNKLKKYCEFSGMTYNPADITKLKKDGERWRTRDEKGVLTPYIYIRYQEISDPVPMNQAF